MTTVQNDNLAHDGQTTFLPTSAHFLLNDKCNAKCVFCGGNYFNSRSGRMMTLEKFKIIADNIHLEHYRQAILAGAGDPLLCPDFVPIMQHLHAAYPTVEISVTTNGIALNRELGEAMLACGIKMLNISLNAATKDTYLRLMQVDAFDRICEQIRDFSKLCREHGRGPQLQLSIPIMRCNVEELPLLIQFAHEVGAGAVNVFYCRFYPREIRNDKDGGFLPDKESLYFYQELSDRIVTESERLAQRLGVQLMHEPLFSQGYVPKSCSWTDNELMIGFDGEVFPCGGGELHFKKKLERGEYNFGNALQQPIEEFWNNDSYRAIRVSSKRSGQCVIPECRECSNMTSHMEQRGHILEWADFSNGSGLDATDAASLIPLVSVIVPTHNRPDMLKETIQSIFDQTFQDFEIIVVNDAGQDVSSVVHAFNSPKITYISHETNKGLAASRNTGIRTARGKYIAYLDDDDIYYPEHLETLVTFLQESGESVAYTDAYRAHQIMQEDGTYAIMGRDVPYSFDFNFKNLLVGNFIPVTCFMHDIKCIHEAGYFDEDLHSHEDWDLWIRMSQKYAFHHIKKLTCEFRWREDGTSMTSSKEPEFISTQERIYEKYQHIASKMPDVAQAQQRELYNRKKNAGVAVPVACSIIIPVFNQVAYTKQCLEMLYANTSEDLSFEVIIVDNASSDDTAEFLNVATQRYRNLWVIRNNENLLFAKACNQGAQAACGEYLVFLNNDTEPLPGWLDHGLARLKSDPAIGIVGSKLLYPDGTIQHCGIEFLPRTDLAPPYNVWPTHRFLYAAADDPRVNTSEEVPMVTGACLFISKKLFQAIDGFCPDYGLYFEDIDLCMKVHKQGKIIWYEPQSILVHHESKSSQLSRKDLDSLCLSASVIFFERWKSELKALSYKSALSNQKVKVGAAREPAIVIDGVIFQLQHGRPFGISRLWWSLLTEMAATPMAERIVLLDREGTAPEIPGIRRRRVSAFQLGTAREESPGLDQVCNEEKAGLLVSTYYTYSTATPTLLMLYDMIPERFDTVGPAAPNPEWRDKHHAIANSSAFAAISQSTARDLATFYPQAAERPLSIIPCAVSDDFRMHSAEEIAAFKSTNGIDRPYFLLVGRRDPHKNAALFFQAFASLPDRQRYAIVMAGGGHVLEPELRALAGPAAGYAGFFSDRDLSLAYSGAIALVYPSLYEGFGLPILEAMQSGCPVITCQNSSLPEVAGSAALYVGEQDVEGMSRALLEVQDPDVRAYLIKRGAERARLFSWQKGAELLAEAIQQESSLISNQSTTPSSHPENKDGVFLNTEPGKSCESIASQKESSPLISAIVSTYNSERYIRGCIEDLEHQTIADQIEIIVIDSCSPEQEGRIVHELQQVYSNIRYIRTEERETVYAAWNRAIQVARGRYLTNANTDDRHRADAFERMAAVLNDDPAIDLVYADALITTTPNETFEQCTRTGVFTWLEPDRNALLYRGCFIGPQPLWRKSLHEVYGLFDPKYITSGDYEFWLRVSQTASFHHIAEPLGLYLSSPTSIEHTNEERKGRENNQLLFRYRNAAIEGKLQGFMPFSQLRSILSSGSWGARQDDVAKLISYIGTLVNSASHRLGYIYGRLEQEILSSTACSSSDLERFISLAGRMIVENSDWYTVDINSIRDEAVLQGVYVRQIIRKARLLAMRNEFDGAVETLLQQGIRQVSGDQAPYLALMEILIVAGRLNDALEVVAQLPEGADRVTVQYLRAVCHEKLTEYDAAQKCAADAFTMAPDDARVLTILGVLAFHSNQREEAIRLFEEALLADPGFGEPYANLGVIRWTAGEREAGFSLLEQAATLSPLDNDIRALYYGAAGESNAYSQAEQHFKDEAAMYPESRGVIRFLLDVLEKQGKNNEAMERLEEALVSFGCDDDLLDMALEVRNRIGRPPKIREKDKNSISLCMIVKNEASDLAICLSSTKPVADEMIVIDTGSSDRTADIATAFGARVYNFTWNGNFSDARNYAINKARGRWILVMDADEVLAMKDYETVRRAVREASGKKLAWSVLTRNYTTRVNAQGWTQNDHAYPEEERADGWHPSWKVRLFPHDRRIRFSGEVHEMVEHSLRQAGFSIKPASFIIHHYGGLNDIKNREKMLHYFELGRQKLGENPDDGIALQELATQAGELELYDEAIDLWDRLLQIDPNNVDALFNKGYNLIGLRRYEEALVISNIVLELEPYHKEAAFNYGTSELYVGEPAAAVQRIEPILQRFPDYPPLLAVMTLLYLLSAQREKAVATFTQLKTLNYAIVEYAKDRGLMLSKLGKGVDARKLLDECAAIGMDVY